jgi:hypothetical protein
VRLPTGYKLDKNKRITYYKNIRGQNADNTSCIRLGDELIRNNQSCA